MSPWMPRSSTVCPAAKVPFQWKGFAVLGVGACAAAAKPARINVAATTTIARCPRRMMHLLVIRRACPPQVYDKNVRRNRRTGLYYAQENRQSPPGTASHPSLHAGLWNLDHQEEHAAVEMA